MTDGYSAYVPCFNDGHAVRAAVESLLGQTCRPVEVIVIDDGSTDGSADRLAGLPIRVVRHPRNMGRGAARARAMAEAQRDAVLCCDATNTLPDGFAARALNWLRDARVAAACGPLFDPAPRGAIGRWRARHLFKQGQWPSGVVHGRALATYGAMVRKSAIESVGGFDGTLRHSEDVDLGGRLVAAGLDVVFDPALATVCNVQNSIGEVLERYWRWSAGKHETFTAGGFTRHAWYAVRTLALSDLATGDVGAACISVALPLYLAATMARRRVTGKRQRPNALPAK